ncbi:hypothetical protein [Streptomyces sp. B15]|uniref:hypothetical protein n=1 Tax=Streptomyces sp. B15 TaxID=1537797 RepID=UPI001B3834B5|nr:hypothetical protein [Streptomyces sp. B15]MBQ1119508.1 hypothetical protein [Streptomyces sp. B15]
MAISYEDIINSDLGDLETAAKSWETMGKRFGTLGGHYRDHVRAAVDADSWQGKAAHKFGQWGRKTAEEYDQAKGEAHGVAALLRLAHATLTARKKAVEAVRDDAQDEGLDVDSRGRCTMNLEKVEAKKGKKVADEYREDKQARAMAEENWNKAIKKAVRETQEADAALKEIFMADPKEPERGLPNGFNGAIGDEAVKKSAKRAAETYKDIRDGKNPSPEELREAGILARGLDDDPVFSRTLINSIGGPEGLIKTHNRLDDLAYADDTDRKKTFLSLDKGLAVNLASATKEPNTAFYKEFQAKMRDVGLKKYDMKLVAQDPGDAPGPGPVRGYQSLVSLMQRGDDDYGKQFLTDTADSIRVAEDEDKNGDPDVWDLQGNFDGKKYAHFANDPYDGILDVMSRQPDVATEYLDPGEPGEKGKNDNLAYLLNDRNWKTVDGGPVSPDGSDPDQETSHSRQGLAHALEAAATGEQPQDIKEPARLDATHTKAEARVMNRAIEFLDPGQGGGAIHPNLQEPMANALADYAPDTHRSLYSADNVRDDPSVSGSEGDAQLSASPEKLIRVMRGASESPDAYSKIYDAERAQIQQGIAKLPDGLTPEHEDVIDQMRRAGAGMGAMEAIKEDIVGDEANDELDKIQWKAKIKYHVIGGLVTPVGGGRGDPLQRFVDTWAWEDANEESAAVRKALNEENTDLWLSSDFQIRNMVNRWATSSGHSEDDPSVTNLTAREAMGQRNDARRDASQYLK